MSHADLLLHELISWTNLGTVSIRSNGRPADFAGFTGAKDIFFAHQIPSLMRRFNHADYR